MKKLQNEVKQSINNEYDRAAKKFGPKNNSLHESYAVILEEFEEAQLELDLFKTFLRNFWNNTKENNSESAFNNLKDMQERAEQAACELIQVAAMCHKASLS